MREHTQHLPKVSSHLVRLDEKLNSSITAYPNIYFAYPKKARINTCKTLINSSAHFVKHPPRKRKVKVYNINCFLGKNNLIL